MNQNGGSGVCLLRYSFMEKFNTVSIGLFSICFNGVNCIILDMVWYNWKVLYIWYCTIYQKSQILYITA